MRLRVALIVLNELKQSWMPLSKSMTSVRKPIYSDGVWISDLVANSSGQDGDQVGVAIECQCSCEHSFLSSWCARNNFDFVCAIVYGCGNAKSYCTSGGVNEVPSQRLALETCCGDVEIVC